MLEIETAPDYERNLEATGNGKHLPCVVCGRGIRRPRFMVRLWCGTHVVTEEEAAALLLQEQQGGEGTGDMGSYPIGPDCLRKHPEYQPYVDGGG